MVSTPSARAKMQVTAGEKLGRWTPQKRERHAQTRRWMWFCKCECGTEKWALETNLRRAGSCGCQRRESLIRRNTKHGKARTPEYKVWLGMLSRCRIPSATGYCNYGGRGIRVCDEWSDFARFLADMGPRPSPKHTLERENNERDYGPGNCSWENRAVQNRNTSRNVFLTNPVGGRRMCLADWAAELGVSPPTMSRRVSEKWPPERLFAGRFGTPKRPCGKLYTRPSDGKTQTAAEWAAELGLKGNAFRLRVRRGWAGEKLFSVNNHMDNSSEGEHERS